MKKPSPKTIVSLRSKRLSRLSLVLILFLLTAAQSNSSPRLLLPVQKRNPAGTTPEAPKAGQFQLLPEIGFTTMNYRETGISPYSAVLLTGKLSAQFTLISTKLYLYSNVLYSGFNQFASTPGIGAALIWFNAGVSYTLSFSSWHAGLRTGWYYGTMLVTANQFGFSGLYGLSATPFITKDLGSTTNVGGYFKFAPALDPLRLSATANAAGLLWTKTLRNRQTIQVNLDYSFTNLIIDESTVSLTAISLNFSYSGLYLNF